MMNVPIVWLLCGCRLTMFPIKWDDLRRHDFLTNG